MISLTGSYSGLKVGKNSCSMEQWNYSSKPYNIKLTDVLDDKKNLHLGQNDQDFDIFNQKK